MLPNDIKVLKKIEKEQDVISIFQYKDTAAWISIKDMLTTIMYDKNIRLENGNKKDIVSIDGIKIIFSSLYNYIKYYKNRKIKKNLFLGASTGLFSFKGKVLDAYFPYYDMKSDSAIYMLNCGSLQLLEKYKVYTEKNHIVIENYLIVVLKKVLSKFLYLTLSKKKREQIDSFNSYLKKENINISTKALCSKYMEFIAGYKLYKLFFKFLNIEKAYIVSAPSKSDMVAALKSLDIETVEIQHGIVGELHRGYNFNFEPNSYLPVVDRIDVYNQFWKDEIVRAGYFREDSINTVGRLKYDIVRSNLNDLDFNYIVFTGQGAFFKEIINFFIEADDYLSQKNIKMFYKAHPRELKSEIIDFKSAIKDLKSCLFYEGEHTTEELIKNSYAHVSVFSSCHFDAVYFNDKTYVLDIMEENIMQYYIQTSPSHFIKIKKIEEL